MATTNKTSKKVHTDSLEFVHTTTKIKVDYQATTKKENGKIVAGKVTSTTSIKSASHTCWLRMYALVSRTEEKYDSESDYEVKVWFENRGKNKVSDEGKLTVKMGEGTSGRTVKSSTFKNVKISLNGRKEKVTSNRTATTSKKITYYSTESSAKKAKFTFKGRDDTDSYVDFYIGYESTKSENHLPKKNNTKISFKIGTENCKTTNSLYRINLPKNDAQYTYAYYTKWSEAYENHSQGGYVVGLDDVNFNGNKAQTISGNKIDLLYKTSTYKVKCNNKLRKQTLARYGASSFKLGIAPDFNIVVSTTIRNSTTSKTTTKIENLALHPKAENYFWTGKWYAKKANKVYGNRTEVKHNADGETYHPIFIEDMLCVRYYVGTNSKIKINSNKYQIVEGYIIPKGSGARELMHKGDMNQFALINSSATTPKTTTTHKYNPASDKKEWKEYGQRWQYSETKHLINFDTFGIKKIGYNFKGYTAKSGKTDLLNTGENGISGKQLAKNIDKILAKYPTSTTTSKTTSTTTTRTREEALQINQVSYCTVYPIWEVQKYQVQINLRDGVTQEEQQSFTLTCEYGTSLNLMDYKTKAKAPDGMYFKQWEINRVKKDNNEQVANTSKVKVKPSYRLTFNENLDNSLALTTNTTTDSVIIINAVWETVPFKFNLIDHFQTRTRDDQHHKGKIEDKTITMNNRTIHGTTYQIGSVLTYALIKKMGEYAYTTPSREESKALDLKDANGNVISFDSYSLMSCSVNNTIFEISDELQLTSNIGVLKTSTSETEDVVYRLISIERNFYYAPEPVFCSFQFNSYSLNLYLAKSGSTYTAQWDPVLYRNEFYYENYNSKLYNAASKNTKLEKNGYLFLGWKLISEDKQIDSLVSNYYVLKNGLLVSTATSSSGTTVNFFSNLSFSNIIQDPIIIAIPQYLELTPLSLDTTKGRSSVYSYRALIIENVVSNENGLELSYSTKQIINRGYSLMKDSLDSKFVVNKEAVDNIEDPLLIFNKSPIMSYLSEAGLNIVFDPALLKISFKKGAQTLDIEGDRTIKSSDYTIMVIDNISSQYQIYSFSFDTTAKKLEVSI